MEAGSCLSVLLQTWFFFREGKGGNKARACRHAILDVVIIVINARIAPRIRYEEEKGRHCFLLLLLLLLPQFGDDEAR